ncbi:unnamed protein product [Cuscuta epithymum]|uniref:Argonaute 4 n=1 Tax=Cuscuta epithymum TaxID=186058 RepID=A0AAV0CEQ4_9ASTE|nr:unnamed protein product [Cuscuta epithymum]CAH9145341.1 unnamed protein product [Cuscuta epithymum]
METSEPQLPPPPPLPTNFTPKTLAVAKRAPMGRRGFATTGDKIQLLTNHFRVGLSNTDGCFFQYSVSLTYEDGNAVDAKGVGRRVIDQVYETYGSELAGKHLAYDGDKTLFTLGALPGNKLEFTVVLDDMISNRNTNGGDGSPEGGSPNDKDRKRSKRQPRSKTYNVAISYATRIPMQAIADALRGKESENFQEAVRVLDIILRQQAAKQGCLLVRQSFFHNEPKNFVDLGGGVAGCRGFHSSFRATQGGLSLNIDVTTTMTVKPGPVIDFLLENQNVKHPRDIDWSRAKKALKSLRVTVKPSNREHKITGFSDKICSEQTFTLKRNMGRKDEGDESPIEMTVYDYFVNHRSIHLQYSGNFPCINVGKPKRPTFIPIELCSLVSLQRYTKSLSNLQRASLVEKSRQKPPERMNVLKDALGRSDYNSDPLLKSCGVVIYNQFTEVQGRVLKPPKLLYGNQEGFFPRNGRWNFNQKKLFEPVKIEKWAVVNFSARCDVRKLCRDLQNCGQMKGIMINPPFDVFDEEQQFRRAPAPVRVEKMGKLLKSRLPGKPDFILCILSERKNCDIYGPWKKMNLSELGVVTQCIAPTRVNDQYLTNVLLKINAKLGGMNSLLASEHLKSIPLVSTVPTIIVGMDVSHGSPGRADVPSIAAVVSSRGWPCISRYRASVRTQSPKLEMIDSLYKRVSDSEKDEGMFRELLVDFYSSTQQRKPDQIIIFRDGVSESQFNQVLNIELEQIIEACKLLDESWSPKFTVIVAQKNHNTKFFPKNSPDNVPPGTVIDNGICHPKNNDFYMCAHAGMIGTSRPTHYHILHDEIGFSPDALQELVHSLSYVYQRSTTAISVVAPICYAHLAAAQAGQFIKFDDFSDTSSSHGGVGTPGAVPVPQLPVLHANVKSSMFFC